MKIGIVSDTHDLLRPEVLADLEDCGTILHAGDISSPGILERLREIAPVYAVRGNNDRDWDDPLPLVLDFELAGLRIAMAHKKKDLPEDLSAFDLAVTGHTHRYAEARLAGVKRTLLLNPGCCGPRLFRQPVTMAKVTVGQDGWKAERIDIPQGEKETAPPVPGRDIRRQIEGGDREKTPDGSRSRRTDRAAVSHAPRSHRRRHHDEDGAVRSLEENNI